MSKVAVIKSYPGLFPSFIPNIMVSISFLENLFNAVFDYICGRSYLVLSEHFGEMICKILSLLSVGFGPSVIRVSDWRLTADWPQDTFREFPKRIISRFGWIKSFELAL